MAKKKQASRARPEKTEKQVLHRVFMERTCQAHQNHRRHAKEAGQWVDYDLAELRRVVSKALLSGRCDYCQGTLDERNWSIDHKVPTSRLGGHALVNLLVCCLRCNQAKGPLDHVEWRQLMQVLNSWSTAVKDHTLARLRAGASRMRSGVARDAAPRPTCLPGAAHVRRDADRPGQRGVPDRRPEV